MSAGGRLDHLRDARLDLSSGGDRLTGVNPRGIIRDDPTAKELEEFVGGDPNVRKFVGTVEAGDPMDHPEVSDSLEAMGEGGPVEVEIHPGSVEVFADPDEPLFVLRARDRSAPGVVVDWIRANIETAPESKLREALDQALRMRRYPYRRNAD